MGTWQDAIHREGAQNSPATDYVCRIYVQGAIRRPQADQAPDMRRSTAISGERSYNEFSASNRCRAGRVRCDFCTPSCADAAAVSTSGNAGASEAGAACACGTTRHTTTSDDSGTQSNDSAAAHNATTSGVTRAECATSDRGVLSDLPGRPVPRVLRRRTRSALLPLRSDGAICGRGDVLQDTA